MRVLVTGHQKFESAHLLKPWLQQGHQVFGIDTLDEPNLLPAVLGGQALPLETQLVEALTLENLHHAVERIQPDLILHLMQSQHSKLRLRDFQYHYKKSIESTALLFQVLEETKEKPKLIAMTISDRTNGQDAHSLSHLQRSQLAQLVRQIPVIQLTHGSLVGVGDLREDSLFHQMIKEFLLQKEFVVRKPYSVRSFQSASATSKNIYQGLMKALEHIGGDLKVDSSAWCLGPRSQDMLSVGAATELFAVELGFKELIKLQQIERGPSYHPSPDCSEFDRWLGQNLVLEDSKKSILELAQWYRDYYALKS